MFEFPILNVRKWRVKGFDNHLVFYEPRPDGVCIVRDAMQRKRLSG